MKCATGVDLRMSKTTKEFERTAIFRYEFVQDCQAAAARRPETTVSRLEGPGDRFVGMIMPMVPADIFYSRRNCISYRTCPSLSQERFYGVAVV